MIKLNNMKENNSLFKIPKGYSLPIFCGQAAVHLRIGIIGSEFLQPAVQSGRRHLSILLHSRHCEISSCVCHHSSEVLEDWDAAQEKDLEGPVAVQSMAFRTQNELILSV